MCGAGLQPDRPLFAPAALNGHPALRGFPFGVTCAQGAKTKGGKGMSTPRRKLPALRVYCLEDEYSAIKINAAAAGMSASQYLRSVGIGYQVRSIEDQRMATTLVRINADLGRLGGLLKALLTNDERFDDLEGEELQRVTISTIRGINEHQDRLRCIVEGITGK